jgi:hypothetical protein
MCPRGVRRFAQMLNKGLQMQGLPETCGRPGRLINRCPLKPMFFKLFQRRTDGSTNILEVDDNFRRNSVACLATLSTELPAISIDFDLNPYSSKLSRFSIMT